MLELAALLVVVAYLAWRDHQTAVTLAAATPDLIELVALVDRLCQRVQAPDVAVAEHAAAQGPVWAPPAVPMDDDEAHFQSKEALAEQVAMMEAASVHR